jgi:hypothetical protein
MAQQKLRNLKNHNCLLNLLLYYLNNLKFLSAKYTFVLFKIFIFLPVHPALFYTQVTFLKKWA